MSRREMEAGPGIDALVATEVCGFFLQEWHGDQCWFGWRAPEWPIHASVLLGLMGPDTEFRSGLPLFSRSPSAALAVLDRFWKGDFVLRRQSGSWGCVLFEPSRQWGAWADTLPLAICRALLVAVSS